MRYRPGKKSGLQLLPATITLTQEGWPYAMWAYDGITYGPSWLADCPSLPAKGESCTVITDPTKPGKALVIPHYKTRNPKP